MFCILHLTIERFLNVMNWKIGQKNQLNFDSWAVILRRPWSLRNKTFTKCTSSNIH